MASLNQSQTGYTWSFSGFDEGNSATYAWAQAFTPSSSGPLHSVILRFYKNGTPTGNIHLKIYSDSSNSPNALIGEADSVIPYSSVEEAGNEITFNFFNSEISLSSSTKYWLVYYVTDYSYPQYANIGAMGETSEVADPYASGKLMFSTNFDQETPTWNNDNAVEGSGGWNDIYFKQYYAVSSISLSPSVTPSVSISLSPSASFSPSSSPSSSPSVGSSPSLSPSVSASITPSLSISVSVSRSISPSPSASVSPSSSVSLSLSPSPSPAYECDQTQLVAEDMNTTGITSANGGAWAYGQSFVPSSEYPVGKVQVKVKRSGAISGTLRLLVMDSLNGNPLSVIDTSNNTHNISPDLQVDVATALDFYFSYDVFLVPGRTYFIVLDGVDIVAPFAGAIKILGSDAYSAGLDAYTSGKLMYTESFDGVNDTWVNAAGNDEGVAWWADMYFRICFDPLAWSTSPSISVSLSISSSQSPSLTQSASISPSFSPSVSISASPSRSQYEEKYTIKNTPYTDKYKKW